MAAGKRFSTQLSGYNKEDVNEYIDAMVEAFKNRLAEKEKAIAELKKQLTDITLELEEARLKLEVKDEISKSPETPEAILIEEEAAEEEIPSADAVESVYYINDNEAQPLESKKDEETGQNEDSDLHKENQRLMKENEGLREEIGVINEKSKEVIAMQDELTREKNKVAQALYLADESAHTIIFNAESKAATIVQNAEMQIEEDKRKNEMQIEEDRRKNEKMMEEEREKIVDIKRELRNMRSTFSVLLRKYENEIELVMDSNEWK